MPPYVSGRSFILVAPYLDLASPGLCLTFWVRGAVRRGLLNPMVMPCVCVCAVASSCV